MGIQYPLYMMNIPVSYDTSIRNNAWMETYSEQEISVNLTEAIHELWEVYSFLSRYGFVYLLPSTSDCGLQDLVFVSNNGIVLHHMSEPTYIGSNFRVANRRGEEVLGMDFFCRLGYNTYHQMPSSL